MFVKYEPVSLRVVIALLNDKLQNTTDPQITKYDLMDVFEMALAAKKSAQKTCPNCHVSKRGNTIVEANDKERCAVCGENY